MFIYIHTILFVGNDNYNFQRFFRVCIHVFPVKPIHRYNVRSKIVISISVDISWPLKLFTDGAGDHSTLGGWAIPQCTASESGGDGESGGEGEKTGKLKKRLEKVHIMFSFIVILSDW